MKIFLLGVLCVQVLGLPHHSDDPFAHAVAGPKMTVTPGDLKRFSGHALKLLQAKCPKVEASTIFELNKFIGKAIAKDSNPVPGDGPEFREVIKSITTCSSEVAKVKPVAEDESDGSPEFFFFSSPFQADAQSSDEVEVKIMPKPDEAEEAPEVTKEPETAVSPIEAKVSTERQVEKRHPFIDWVSRVVTSVRDFFRNMFGTRHRRASGDSPAPSSSGPMHPEVLGGDTTGKGAFTQLFDEICRIYCENCHTSLLSRHQIKTTAKELLDHIFKIVPNEGIELAATHHLTKGFMQTVKECE